MLDFASVNLIHSMNKWASPHLIKLKAVYYVKGSNFLLPDANTHEKGIFLAIFFSYTI